MATLIESAKLNGVDPQAWLTDVLERMVSGRTKAHRARTAAAVDLEGRAARGRRRCLNASMVKRRLPCIGLALAAGGAFWAGFGGALALLLG